MDAAVRVDPLAAVDAATAGYGRELLAPARDHRNESSVRRSLELLDAMLAEPPVRIAIDRSHGCARRPEAVAELWSLISELRAEAVRDLEALRARRLHHEEQARDWAERAAIADAATEPGLAEAARGREREHLEHARAVAGRERIAETWRRGVVRILADLDPDDRHGGHIDDPPR
jgi:hypothetical protein